MSPVVWDEDFLIFIDHDSVGELQMLGASKFVEDISHLIEDDDPHHLALHNNDQAFVVNTNTTRMLKNVGTKLTDKLTILVVDLNL